MMNWDGTYGGGPGVIGGILMMVFWVAIIVGIVLLLVWLVRQVSGGQYAGGPHAQGPGGSAGGYAGGESAIDILNKRYANGEIDKAEYEQKKKDLTA